jgi:hypothetical protein
VRIRPFRDDDAPAVAALWEYWFRSKTRDPAPGLTAMVRRLFVEHPNRDDEVTPLVAEGTDGAMLGFLGTTVTPVHLDGREQKLAGVFPPIVDPDIAATTVASFLLRRFLTGPQAFTLSDGGHVRFERIWETLGGRIAQLQSLRWVKVFRPLALGSGMLAKGRVGRVLYPMVSPLAAGADWLVRRSTGTRFTARPSDLHDEPLTTGLLIDAVEALHGEARMRPNYRPEYLTWLFDELARITSQGSLHARLVRAPDGAIAGWYVYYAQPAGTSRVFALDAVDRHLDAVIDRLFEHAQSEGAAALTGRLDPRLRRPMAARGCLVHAGGSLLMVHSRDASLMDDAQLGRLAFSRLEGENWYWWGLISHPVP